MRYLRSLGSKTGTREGTRVVSSMTNKSRVEIGDTWGKLTIIAEEGRNRWGARLVRCRCECGNERVYISSVIKRKSAVSCGCFTRSIMKGRHLPYFRKSKYGSPEKSARNALYIDYKSKAKKNNRDFKLSWSEFEKITTEPCYFCGDVPRRVVKRRKSPNEVECLANGIDRLNNDLGYTVENSVACCEMCNRAKLSYPLDEFMAWVKRAHDHLFAKRG